MAAQFPMEKNKRIYELAVCVILFGAFAYLFQNAVTTAKPAPGGAMASMDFPKAILLTAMAMCVAIAARTVTWFTIHREKKREKGGLLPSKSMVTFALLCVYVLLWKTIGFCLSTFLFFTCEAYFLDRKRPLWLTTLIGLGCAVFIVFVFGYLFKVQFPEPLLKLIRGY